LSALNQRTSWRHIALLVAGVLLAAIAGIQVWAHDPNATQSAARMVAVLAASLFFGALYVRCIAATAARGELFKFRLRDLFLMVTAVAGFSIAGFALDALVLGLLIAFTAVLGPVWRGLIHQRTALRGLPAVCLVSVAVLSSFVMIAMALAVALMQLELPKDFPYPMTLSLSLWTSAMFAWVFLLGDNARSPMQLVLYGLPVGIPVNIILAFVAGTLSGWLAYIFNKQNNKVA